VHEAVTAARQAATGAGIIVGEIAIIAVFQASPYDPITAAR
jgi:hypothetical protein